MIVASVLYILAVRTAVGSTDGKVICLNTCETKNNGVCDDGGTDSTFGTCDLGTDCEDCGPREGEVGACEDDAAWVDEVGSHTCKDFAHNRFWCTDFGDYSEKARNACPVSCGLCSRALDNCECAGVNNYMGHGEKCTEEHLYSGLQWCYVSRETCPNALWSELKEINDQNLGFIYCGDVDFTDEECNETCAFTDDGSCDDGGPGSDSSACPLGTDCLDCGPRVKGPDSEEVEITSTYYSKLSECISQSVEPLGTSTMTAEFPASPEIEPICIPTGTKASEQVSCDALGVVTKKPYKDSTCGDDGGKLQGEKKWAFWLRGLCVEDTFNGEEAFKRMDWSGPCVNEEEPVQRCSQEEAKMSIKNAVKSDEVTGVQSDCECSMLCAAALDADDKEYTHFTWTESNGGCQCFRGKFKKYKAKSGTFSGPL